MPVTTRTCIDPTSAKSWALEQKLLRAYRRLLFAADLDALIDACFGPKLSPARREKADERLEHAMPELLQKLTPDEQAPFAEWLLGESPNLVAAVQELAKRENGLWRRDTDPRLNDNGDDWKVKPAGLGKFRQPLAGTALKQHLLNKPTPPPLGPPLVLTPWPPVAPKFRGVRAKHKPQVRVSPRQLVLPFLAGGMMEGGL